MNWGGVTFRTKGTGGRVGGTIFGLFFCLIPLVIICVLLYGVRQSLATRFWTETPCRILESCVEVVPITVEKPETYAFRARYSYEFGGKSRVAETVRHGYEPSENRADTLALAGRFKEGTAATCWVNPASCDEAVLLHEGLGKPALLLLVTLFPMLFIAIGVFVIIASWRADRPQPISSKAAGKPWVMLAFFAIFFLFGAGFLWVMLAHEALDYVRSSSWIATPCEIVDSRVLHSSGKNGGTWKVGVVYRYEFGGGVHCCNRYALWSAYSSGYDGKKAVVDRLKPGSKATCRVNPSDPDEALLVRELGWEALIALQPLTFAAIGFFGMRWAWRQMRSKKAGKGAPRGTGLPERHEPTGAPATLKPETSGIVKVLGSIGLAVFWNGIVSVFLFEVIREWHEGHSPWGLTLFLVPFVVIGLVFIGAVFYYMMALFNPRVHLEVSAKEVTLGGTVDVAWEIIGSASRLRRLDICVEGREQGTAQSGKSSVTETSVFERIVLASVEDPAGAREGRAQFVVPPESMHTFKADHAKIAWHIVVKGDVPWWPDVKDEYELTVLPYDPKEVLHEHAQA